MTNIFVFIEGDVLKDRKSIFKRDGECVFYEKYYYQWWLNHPKLNIDNSKIRVEKCYDIHIDFVLFLGFTRSSWRIAETRGGTEQEGEQGGYREEEAMGLAAKTATRNWKSLITWEQL